MAVTDFQAHYPTVLFPRNALPQPTGGCRRLAYVGQREQWSRCGAMIPEPPHYKCGALPIELHRRDHRPGEAVVAAYYRLEAKITPPNKIACPSLRTVTITRSGY